MAEAETANSIVHPGTGEVIVLADELDIALAGLHQELVQIVAGARAAMGYIEEELANRMTAAGRRQQDVGEYTLRLRTGRSRQWDPDDTEAALHELVESGVIKAKEAIDVVRREPKVNGREALALLDRLDGEARTALERCYQWQEGRRGVQITQQKGEPLDGSARR